MRKTLLPFVAPVVTWPQSCSAELFKRGLVDSSKTHTELSNRWAQQQETKAELQDLLLSSLTMKAALTAVAVLVLALSWTSEAVQVEVSLTADFSLWVMVSGWDGIMACMGNMLLLNSQTMLLGMYSWWTVIHQCILYSCGLQTTWNLCKPCPRILKAHIICCIFTSANWSFVHILWF